MCVRSPCRDRDCCNSANAKDELEKGGKRVKQKKQKLAMLEKKQEALLKKTRLGDCVSREGRYRCRWVGGFWV